MFFLDWHIWYWYFISRYWIWFLWRLQYLNSIWTSEGEDARKKSLKGAVLHACHCRGYDLYNRNPLHRKCVVSRLANVNRIDISVPWSTRDHNSSRQNITAHRNTSLCHFNLLKTRDTSLDTLSASRNIGESSSNSLQAQAKVMIADEIVYQQTRRTFQTSFSQHYNE